MDALPEPFPENYYVEIPCPGTSDQTESTKDWNNQMGRHRSRFEEEFHVLQRKRLATCCHPALTGLAEDMQNPGAWGIYSTDAYNRSSSETFTFREFRCDVYINEDWEKVERLRDLMMREAQMMALLNQNTEKLSVIEAAWLEQRITTSAVEVPCVDQVAPKILVGEMLQHISKYAPFLAMIPNFLDDSDTSDSETSDDEDNASSVRCFAEPKASSFQTTWNNQSQSTIQSLEIAAYIQMESHIGFEDWVLSITRKSPEGVQFIDERIQRKLFLDAFYQIVEQVEAIHCEGMVHLHLCKHNINVSVAENDIHEVDVYVGALAFLSRPGKRERHESYHDCDVFCSPELKKGQQCDSHSDMFSLGLLLLHMVCHAAGLGPDLTHEVLKEATEGFHCPPTIISDYQFETEMIQSLISENSYDRLECFEILSKINERDSMHTLRTKINSKSLS